MDCAFHVLDSFTYGESNVSKICQIVMIIPIRILHVANVANLSCMYENIDTVMMVMVPLQAFEIMWTPQDEKDTLSEREMLTHYPSLRSL